jgi:hypothetical protein
MPTWKRPISHAVLTESSLYIFSAMKDRPVGDYHTMTRSLFYRVDSCTTTVITLFFPSSLELLSEELRTSLQACCSITPHPVQEYVKIPCRVVSNGTARARFQSRSCCRFYPRRDKCKDLKNVQRTADIGNCLLCPRSWGFIL